MNRTEECTQTGPSRTVDVEINDWQAAITVCKTNIIVIAQHKARKESRASCDTVNKYKESKGVNFSYYLNDDFVFLKVMNFKYNPDCFIICIDWTVTIASISPKVYRILAAENHRVLSYETALKEKIEVLTETIKEKDSLIGSAATNQLSSLRNDPNTDFSIECSDNVSISVHKLVMKTYWPFFKPMMENTCKETVEDVLKLEYESDTVELLVSFLYGQKIEIDFSQALCLLELSGIYLLPGLGALAFKKLSPLENELNLEQCVNGWKSARLGQHTEAKAFFTNLLVIKAKPILKEKEGLEFDVIAPDETMELFLDCLRA